MRLEFTERTARLPWSWLAEPLSVLVKVPCWPLTFNQTGGRTPADGGGEGAGGSEG